MQVPFVCTDFLLFINMMTMRIEIKRLLLTKKSFHTPYSYACMLGSSQLLIVEDSA